jgi:anthranilate synthase/aminodeoxychorismate synthase-like glutamine amidotransferase
VLLFVENNDSFSWNVLERLPFPREAVRVVSAADALRSLDGITEVVVGPGPMDPVRAGLIPLVHEVARRGLPFLGVCLGHQALGLAFDAELTRVTPAHGKRAVARFEASRRWPTIQGDVEVMRYHSLALAQVKSPLRVVASLDDGTVMAIEHESLPMAGVQFHPDSFGTPRGEAFFRGALSLRERGPSPRPSPRLRREREIQLSSLRARTDFALLAPSFSTSPHWTLVDFTSSEPNARVWQATAEGRPRALAGHASPVTLELDVSPEALHPQLDETGFLEGVARIREAIAAGDVYQVNLTLRASLAAHDGATLLASLCRRGVPRFAAWVRSSVFGEFVSASPEQMVERRGRAVHVEPMKGTAPIEQRVWLERSEKDRAELAMITDLLRDDLHHLCERDTVRVDAERRFIELPYVLQTVSDVSGVLREDVSTEALLRQLHPGGSVTGAPRPAACELISKLEPTPRGAYCGTLALERDDELTASLLIRTAEKTPTGWRYGVGSGITWDSDAQAELEEVRLKLGALSAH